MGIFYESDYEEALIDLLQEQGWVYTHGASIHRNNRDIIIENDLRGYLERLSLTEHEMESVIDRLKHVPGQSDFDILRNTTKLLRDGFRIERDDGCPYDVEYINFDSWHKNSFRVVNQFEVGYGTRDDVRIPDVLLFVNGIPLCIFELKNPVNENATIADAYEQIHKRYRRDIPHLLRFCPLSCVSDGVKTRLGTTYTPYEHYYAWKKVNNEDDVARAGINELKTIVAGVYNPERFLEILRDYVYFPDEGYGKEEEIVCRYPQFFATRKLRDSVVSASHIQGGDGKGGTYFGATGCGKTYTMAFLARQLAIRCPELNAQGGSPTVVMIVDRDELQTQAGKLFLRSEDFLSLGAAKVIADRNELRTELSARTSGGFFICTIQKFCEEIGLLSERGNIICFSDEAHRTQIHLNKTLKIKTKKEKEDDEIGAFVSKPYAEHLRTAFPNATFVGFTGTPIDETIQVFGKIIDTYNMRQAVEDEITVPIKYIPRMATVTIDEEQLKKIDEYYKQCAEEGATDADIAKSKQAMSKMEIIISDGERLNRLALDIINHYENACNNKPDVIQKAMIVCSKREIGYKLLMKIRDHRPDWFVECKTSGDISLTDDELRKLPEVPRIAMVATRGKNDDKAMYDYLGDNNHRKQLEDSFKLEKSNFRIVLVVDMWITGFDVPCLTYLYNDKPLQKHTLIQTISRVNRKYPGKSEGYIIDYIGIYDQMIDAMNRYGGDNFGPSEDDVNQAMESLIVELEIIKGLFNGFDLGPFMSDDVKPMVRYECLSNAAEFIQTLNMELNTEKGNSVSKVSPKTFFLSHVKRLRAAYDICQPSGRMTELQLTLSQCFMAVAGFLHKTSESVHDTESMNRAVAKMVEEALKCNAVVDILEGGAEENIFDGTFVEKLKNVKLPATRLEVLVKMLRRAIRDYKQVNKIAAEKFEELLKRTLEEYHNRRSFLNEEEASATQSETIEEIIKAATDRALELLKELGEDKDSFRKMGLTFEEKAFYDILIAMRDKYNFEYGEDGPNGNEKCKNLAKKIKEIIDVQSSFADWLNNSNVRKKLAQDIKICLIKNGYPPTYSQEVFDQVMGQVENFKKG